MSEGTTSMTGGPATEPAGGTGAAGTTTATAPAAAGTDEGKPAAATATSTGEPGLEDHEDGLWDVKPGDPAWVKRLRTQGAGYRTKLRETETELEKVKRERDTLKSQHEQRAAAEVADRRVAVAKKHGLWDEAANDGKGGLLPGINLGDGTEEEMTAIAQAITGKLAPRQDGVGVFGRKPATITAETSGTSGNGSSGTSRAADALRELMRARGTTSAG